MRRMLFLLLPLALCVLAGCAHVPEDSGLSVRTTGDARVYGVYFRNPMATDRR